MANTQRYGQIMSETRVAVSNLILERIREIASKGLVGCSIIAMCNLLSPVQSARALTVSVTESKPIARIFTADGAAVVTEIPVSAISSSTFNSSLLLASYPTWIDKPIANDVGNIDISAYDAANLGSTAGGVSIDATFDRTVAPPAGKQLQWIQIITTNSVLGNGKSPYIDPQPNDDDLPFYWTATELRQKTAGNIVTFHDFSKRLSSALSAGSPITWRANLYPVEWDGKETVDIHSGFQWGWNMASATQGSSSAKFINPVPDSSTAIITGIGTSSFSWGDPNGLYTGPSNLSFSPANFNPAPGSVFKFGTLSFYNGTVTLGTGASQVSIDSTANFDNDSDKSASQTTPLMLVDTPNTGTEEQNADYVSLVFDDTNYSFHVYEGDSAQVDIMAEITGSEVNPPLASDKSLDVPDGYNSDETYNLQLVGFSNSTAGGFITASPVPEPPVLAILVTGAWLARLRFRGSCHAECKS